MGVEVLGGVGEVTKKGRGGTQSGGNVIQGGETGGTPIWIIDLVNIGGDVEDGGGDSHQVSETNHGEEGVSEGRQYVGDSQSRSSVVSSGNPVGNVLHRKKTGNGGTVGGAAANF